MNTLLTLSKSDFLSARHWLKSQTISKLFTISGFLIVFLTFSLVLFNLGKGFFLPLSSYKEYGEKTAAYIIHAALITTAWFAFASALGAISTLFHRENKEINYLLTLPVKPLVVSFWIFIKSVIFNLLLLAIIIAPVGLSAATAFSDHITLEFVIRLALVLGLLAIITNSLAILVGFLTPFITGFRSSLKNAFGTSLFVITMIMLIRIIFPENLYKLYDATPEQFSLIYSKLPLSNNLLPTTWLTQTLLFGFDSSTLQATLLALGMGILSLIVLTKKLESTLQFMNSQPFKHALKNPFWDKLLKKDWQKHPLITKEILSLERSPSEVNYVFFLLGMVGFFFLLLGQAYKIRFEGGWQNEITVFSLIWLWFFTTAYALRLVFPLMAKEGVNAWYLFTQPIKKNEILHSKLAFAALTSLPLMLLATLIWYFFPLEKDKLPLVLLSGGVILTIIVINTLLGTIFPNFKEGTDPEKVSTSSMGLVTLFISGVITIGTGLFYFRVLQNNSPWFSAILLVLIMGVSLISIFYLLSQLSLKRYEF